MATRTDRGIKRYLITAGLTGTALNFGGVHLKNPTGSDYVVTIKRIIVANGGITVSTTDYIANFGRKDTNLGGVADGTYADQTLTLRSSEDAGGDSACVIATAAPASASTDAPTTSFGKVAVKLKENVELRFDAPGEPDSGVVLAAGTGFVVKCQGNALNDIDVTFDVVEKWDGVA